MLTHIDIASIHSCEQCIVHKQKTLKMSTDDGFSLLFSVLVADSKAEVGLVVQVGCLVLICVWQLS